MHIFPADAAAVALVLAPAEQDLTHPTDVEQHVGTECLRPFGLRPCDCISVREELCRTAVFDDRDAASLGSLHRFADGASCARSNLRADSLSGVTEPFFGLDDNQFIKGCAPRFNLQLRLCG